MAIVAPKDARAAVELGRPSVDSPHETRITSLLSSSISASSSTTALSLIPLIRAEYSSAAHCFIQRAPVKSLMHLEKARLLLFDAIPVENCTRKSRAWRGLREKVLILWITLLVTFWRQDYGSTLSSDILRDLHTSTRGLLELSSQPEAFIAKLLTEVLVNWASTKADMDVIRERTSSSPNKLSIDFGEDAASLVERRLLAFLPPSGAASLIMASLSVEEAAKSEKQPSAGRIQADVVPSAAAVPLSRRLSETFLSSLATTLDSPSASAAAEKPSAVYARVLDLYTVHILGVRCGQWDYADQVVRLSLLEDEPRANLLVALSRAQAHIATRPERRASAALAEKQAYEMEKRRRMSEVRAKAESAALTADAAVRNQNGASSSRAAPQQMRKPKGASLSRAMRTETEDDYMSASCVESSHTSAGESDNDAASLSGRRSRARRSGQTEMTPSLGREAPEVPTGFAATRANLGKTMTKNRSHDETENKSKTIAPGALKSSSTTTSDVARSPQSSHSASRKLSSSTDTVHLLLKALRGRKLAIIVSILGPLLVLLFSMRHLMVAGQLGSGNARANGRRIGTSINPTAKAGGTEAEPSILIRAVRRIWSTVRMGTQVTYL